MAMMFWYYLMAKWQLSEIPKVSAAVWQRHLGADKVMMMAMEDEVMGTHKARDMHKDTRKGFLKW